MDQEGGTKISNSFIRPLLSEGTGIRSEQSGIVVVNGWMIKKMFKISLSFLDKDGPPMMVVISFLLSQNLLAVTYQENREFIRTVSIEEIRMTFCSMVENKVSRPDGFPPPFFER